MMCMGLVLHGDCSLAWRFDGRRPRELHEDRNVHLVKSQLLSSNRSFLQCLMMLEKEQSHILPGL